MERIVTMKANWFARHGHDVVMVLSDNKGMSPFFPLHRSIRIYDLDINYLDDMGVNPLKWHINQWKRRKIHKIELKEVIRREDPDVIFSVFAEESVFLYGIKHRCRKILEFHFTRRHRLQWGRKGMRRLVDRWRMHKEGCIASRYDAFVVLTERDRRAWPKFDNIHVIPNFVTGIPDVVPDYSRKRIVAFGRLSHEKGYDRLIKVWSMIYSDYPDWSLDIFGNGEAKDSLISTADSLVGNNSIVFHEPVENVYEEMLGSSIYVMPSRYEGFSLVLLEAMSVGLPCVSFDIDCGPSEMIENNKNGFLVPDGDMKKFAGCLRMLMNNEELRERMGREARGISDRFSEAAVMNQWEELLPL